MIPMSSSSSHNTSRRRSGAASLPRRRPLVRSNSSLLGTIKNLVTAPLTWFATTDDFDDSPDLKGKRRRQPPPQSAVAPDTVDGAPRPKRARVKSPDSQIHFHPEPPYVAPVYSAPSSGYLDPPGAAFNNTNNFYRSPSVNIAPATVNPFNFTASRSGISRTMSIDPPQTSLPRDATMTFTPLDRDTSMEASSFIRTSSSIPRDLSMPLPAARGSFRMRTSLTPQPAQPREVSEPPPLSSLAHKPVFVRQPLDSQSNRLSSHSSTSTLGSLVESRRSTRSPMRQHSSLLFGSGSQSQQAESSNASQPPPAERALHELDIYKTPLLPTRSRLRSTTSSSPSDPSFPANISKSDPSDMFRPRRSSQLLLMRDDRRPNGLARKSSYSFLDTDDVTEKEGKASKATKKVNETKPYAGEGGMKKLLARRMKEVQLEDEADSGHRTEEQAGDNRSTSSQSEPKPKVTDSVPPPLPGPSDWQKAISSQPASYSTSSLRVGRTKTHRTHFARPGRPSTKFSAAFEDEGDDAMEEGEEERAKERQELEEAAKRLPAFEVKPGFSFAKEPDVKPVEQNIVDAKEPPIAALPFSFGKPSIPTETATSLPSPVDAPVVVPPARPKSSSAFSFDRGSQSNGADVSNTTSEASNSAQTVPNFFATSKLLSQAPPAAASLLPATPVSFGAPPSAPSGDSLFTPKPSASSTFPSTPAPASTLTPGTTPIKDTENPLWEGDRDNKANNSSQPSFFGDKVNGSGSLFVAATSSTSLFGGSQPVSIFGAAKKDEPAPSSLFGGSEISKAPAPIGFSFGAAKRDEPASSSLFGGSEAPKLPAPGGFSFGAPLQAASASKPQEQSQPKPSMGFGSAPAPIESLAPKPASGFSFGAPAPAADAPKDSLFGATAPTSNPFGASAVAPADTLKPAFGGFAFGGPKEAPKSATATPSPFSFGAPVAAESSKAAPFSFGQSAASAPPSTPAFSFSSGSSSTETKAPASGGMFTFGTPTVIAPTARPVTPPRNDMQEFRMEESPTRDMQANVETKPAEPRPTLGGGGGGFSFSNPSASGSLFGQSAAPPAPAPFSFGSSPSPNPFAAATTPVENKPFGNDFGGSQTPSNPFAFGQNTTSNPDPPRPSTTGSFSFQPSAPPMGTSFSFGATNTNPFAPTPTGGSAPNSPSTFNQPFSFGAPTPQPQSSGFSFGSSQPASPAGVSSSLPQPTTPGGFGGASFGAQPSSPFSAGGVPPPQPSSGGSLFTIGAAPPPVPAAGGPRLLKKLPRRKN
ncbi:hypothetical protein C8J57DRAFT_1317615 [Mycena rebaudengoi]|nr:hypothetical protein C8J57DRAFT_1317615 [Mycena rebaudengoi]